MMYFKRAMLPVLIPAMGAAFTFPVRVPTGPMLYDNSYSRIVTPKVRLPPSSTALQMSDVVAVDRDEPTNSIGARIFEAYKKSTSVATTLFPLWTVLFTGIALRNPSSFTWFTTEYFTSAIAALMLCMGITLTPKDFAKVAANPAPVFLQFSMCYGVMPVLALTLGKVFGLPNSIIAGMVLVGSTNGAQASNLCTYIARGNVALAVLMTTAATLGAIVMTPLLCQTLLGTFVPVDARGIAKSTTEVVLFPIIAGMTTNRFFPGFVKAVLPFAPVVGVISTCLLVGSSVAQVAEPILAAGWSLQLSLMALHFMGAVVGYWLPKSVGFGETSCRTMSIGTAMKSAAFSFLLAKLHFGDYAARIPAAVSIVWMTLTGSVLAVLWRYKPVPEHDRDNVRLPRFLSGKN